MPIYTIKKGDTLSALAQQFGTDVPTLVKANPQITNPDLIMAGATLNVPEGPVAPSADASARTLPAIKTLDQSGTGTVPKTLPDAVGSPLLRFSSAMNSAVELAKRKRMKAMEDLYGKTVPKGALPASDFASFINTTNRAAESFTNPLVDTALDTFKTTQEDVKTAKTKIRAIAEKVAEAGGTEQDVQSILNLTDPETALIKATPFLAGKSGTGDTSAYSPTEKRTLQQSGLDKNPDEKVKSFFLNTPSEFQAEWARRVAAGTAPTDVDIISIGEELDKWQRAQDAKKSGIPTAEDIDALFK